MTRGIIVGDPHAKRGNGPEIRLLTEKLTELVKKEDAEYVVILGDLAHDHAVMHLQAWQSICYMMQELSELTKVYYIVGNHDMLNNTQYLTDNHFFKVFDGMHNIAIIDRPTLVGKTAFIPYVPNGMFNKAFNSLLESCSVDVDDVRLVFAHQEFKGCKMGAIESKDGDEWPENYPLVVSGHIHEKQHLGNVYYPGSPYQTAFGDNQKKTVEIVTTTDDEINFMPVDLGMPEKITKNLTAEQLKKFKKSDDNHYRINLVDTTENITKIKKTKKYKDLQKVVKIVTKPTDKVKVIKTETKQKGFRNILIEIIDSESSDVKAEYKEVSK